MQLKDEKKSILELPHEEVEFIHREVRKGRMDWTKSKAVKKKVRQKKSAQEKSLDRMEKKLKKNPEKIKALLRLLGEDV